MGVKIVIALIAVWLSSAALAFGQSTRPVEGPAAVVEVNGSINDYTADVFQKHVAAARAAGAKTILLELNTPGGAVHSAMRMSRLIKTQRAEVRFVAVVDEMAYSAGALLAVACDRIVMRPNSVIGDCAPIIVGPQGLQTVGAAERAKMESPILAEFNDSAERSGYDPLMMSAMVQYGIVVNYLQSPAGEKRFVNNEDARTLREQGWSNVPGVPTPLDGAEQLLTVSDTLAEKIGLSIGTVDSAEAYAASAGMPMVGRFATTTGEKLVAVLSNDALRSILGMVFLWSLYTAITKPGTGVPEAIAMVSGAVLVGVPLLTGYAGWLELSMILLGVMLIAAELFVIPGFGIAGLSGIILLILGLVLTYAPPELPGGGIIPQMQGTRVAIRNGFVAVTAGLVVSAFLWVWLARYLPRIPYMNRLVLQANVGDAPEPGDARLALENAWPAVGAEGVTLTTLTPGGVARFYDAIINDDRSIDVVSDLGYVTAGTSVVVRERQGSAVIVRAAAKATA